MTMRFLVRGTTALACAAVASSAFIIPANAAPAPAAVASASLSAATLRPTAFHQLSLRPLSPAIPSEDEIAKAKESEAATAAASAVLDAIISSANDKLAASIVEAMGANSSYTEALVILEQRQATEITAKAKADAAASANQKAKAQLGQLAGSLYKSGGLDPSVQSFLTSSDADDTMYQAATLMALSSSRAHTFDTAKATAATSSSLQAQAEEASKAADEAFAAAASSHTQAQVAADAQTAVVADNQAQREILLQRLATLHNTTVELEGARVDELTRKAQEASLQQQITDSNNAPAPVSPPVTAQRPATSPVVPSVVPPRVPTPAVPQAPAAPQAPAPAAPQAPAPAAPVAPKPAAPVTQAPAAPVVTPAPAKPAAPAAPAGSHTQVMVNYAMSKIGGPYQWGGNGPTAFDCSGLVQQAFAAAGISVPRQGTDQFWAAPQRVPLSQMRYGDLLVFNGDGAGRFGHIAIYIGNNQVVQALNENDPIAVTSLSWMSGMSLYPYAARY